jgi:hypothetical protein
MWRPSAEISTLALLTVQPFGIQKWAGRVGDLLSFLGGTLVEAERCGRGHGRAVRLKPARNGLGKAKQSIPHHEHGIPKQDWRYVQYGIVRAMHTPLIHLLPAL